MIPINPEQRERNIKYCAHVLQSCLVKLDEHIDMPCEVDVTTTEYGGEHIITMTFGFSDGSTMRFHYGDFWESRDETA